MRVSKSKIAQIRKKIDTALRLAQQFDAALEEAEEEWGKLIDKVNGECFFSTPFYFYGGESVSQCGKFYLPYGHSAMVPDGTPPSAKTYLERGAYAIPLGPELAANRGRPYMGDRVYSTRIAELLEVQFDAFLKENSTKFDYYSKEFRELRIDVFKRDGETCACCGVSPQPGVSLTVDHIKPFSKYPEMALDINNLQVLCWECNQKKSNKHCTDYRKKGE